MTLTFKPSRWPEVEVWFRDLQQYLRTVDRERALRLTEFMLHPTELLFKIGPAQSHRMIVNRLQIIRRSLLNGLSI